ncbi:conserved hypothetical protein [Talaromyces stipitatus ATCC 10500]|uniref:Tc1-like transposase DDE domain-containing protein n=1 Tax=Talaromyces stipitatus (strain ATCC 10500 / CBS 375.48 / QM 6759 / NRRL 1006) TaxID=441959 RepID=B8LZ95_TALSN|nr:uncharacterized protein TSTA_088840 [Talaromyces stipitatus ATCC 10500]EED21648.1 conserved hypothetical protein [Talaromyces stipitatus ATCC 10500]
MLKGVQPILTQGPTGVSLPSRPSNPDIAMPTAFTYLQKVGNPMPQQHPQSERTNKPHPTRTDPDNAQTTSKSRVSKKSDKRGRPKKISDDLTQKMIMLLENSNGDVSWEQLGHSVGVDGKWLSKQARETRMQYALAHHKWQNEWRSMLFSDFVNFGLGTTRKAKVFNRKDERLCEDCLQSREEIDKALFHCWAMVGYDYKGPLIFLETEDNDLSAMSQRDYISQIIQLHVQPIVTARRMIYLDNASEVYEHATAPQNMVHAYLDSLHLPYIQNPPTSPDLNVLKDVLLLLKKRLQKRSIGDQIQLKIAVLEEWDKITTKEINKLVDTMKLRMEKVLTRKGMPI